MKVTLKDVAETAGVSKATASMALNGSEKVKDETRVKVEKIAKKLNYVPNAISQALTNKKTMTIGVVIPEINNHYYSEMVQTIKNEIRKSDYSMLLCTTDYDVEEEERYINIFKSRQVDGVIFIAHSSGNEEIIEDFNENYAPVVYIDRGSKNSKVPVIRSDVESGIYKVTNHLIELGHKAIGYVGPVWDDREKGYEKALNENNLKIRKEYFYQIAFLKEEIANNNLKTDIEFPTALVCFNDETAYRTILMLRKIGMEVPKDVSISGFDNLHLSEIYNPPLTTVNINKKKMAKKGVELLMKKLSGTELEKDEYYYKYETNLIVRESTSTPYNN